MRAVTAVGSPVLSKISLLCNGDVELGAVFILSAIVRSTVSAEGKQGVAAGFENPYILGEGGEISIFLDSKRILKDIGLLALGIFKENFEACQSYSFPPDLTYFIKKYFYYTRITLCKVLFKDSILSLSPIPT